MTISSCHGAGRRAFAGEGLVGLAWAFLRAGAHEVIAALWEVNDTSTVSLMDTMYRSIHDGHAPADALRFNPFNTGNLPKRFESCRAEISALIISSLRPCSPHQGDTSGR